MPDRSGRTFLITSTNIGIGLEAAKVPAARAARVLRGRRSEQRANSAMEVIRAWTREADLGFLVLDQGNLASLECACRVKAF